MAKTIFIVSHYDGRTGGLSTFEDYLDLRSYNKLLLLHPLDDYSRVNTYYSDSKSRVEIKRRPAGLFNLIIDLLISIKYTYKKKYDAYIGASNFDTLPAIFCRKVLRKKIDRIIYYPRDLSEDRFSSKLLNAVYLRIEKTVLQNADLIINNTLRAQSRRIELGLKPNRSIIMPNPIEIKDINFNDKDIDKHSFIYTGDVSIEHGISEFIDKHHDVIRHLTIIGIGNDLESVKRLVAKHNIQGTFLGHRDKEYVISYLRKFNGFGLAPYNESQSWTYYCSPLKVGEYISCGVPVLMSNRPEIAKLVNDEGYGIVYDIANEGSLATLINNFNLEKYYIKSNKFYKQFNSVKQFDRLEL